LERFADAGVATMSALREGERIQNYILETRLGAGGCGEVWRAKHHVLGDVVAIKVPTDDRFARQLRREGLAAHRLKHPNVVRVIDLDPYATPPYLVMEFIDGPSLRMAIDQYQASFPIGSAVVILRGVLSALQAAHAAGLVHRDVKPGNILLHHPLGKLASISTTAVKVSDFGLGLASGASPEMMQSLSLEASQGRDFAGTVAYMSPEQREGLELDGRSDLYACGIVLFEMLTGERPQGSEVPSALRPGLPRGLDEVFKRCYARSDRRFSSAQQMLESLDGLRVPPAPRALFDGPPPGRPTSGRRSTESVEARSGERTPPPMKGDATRSQPSSEPVGPCTACGGGVEPGDNFCIGCGAAIASEVPKCPHCGAFVDGDDRFCIGCGNRLAETA